MGMSTGMTGPLQTIYNEKCWISLYMYDPVNKKKNNIVFKAMQYIIQLNGII